MLCNQNIHVTWTQCRNSFIAQGTTAGGRLHGDRSTRSNGRFLQILPCPTVNRGGSSRGLQSLIRRTILGSSRRPCYQRDLPRQGIVSLLMVCYLSANCLLICVLIVRRFPMEPLLETLQGPLVPISRCLCPLEVAILRYSSLCFTVNCY